MPVIPDIKTPVIWGLGIMLALALLTAGVERTQVLKARADLSELKASTAEAKTARADAYVKDSDITATKESTHAADTQKATDTFNAGAPDRALALAADLRRANGLLNDAERRAASYRAQAEAGAAECGHLADRTQALDGQLTSGLRVVANLRGDLERRDAEVVLLLDQIDADRKLFGADTVADQ